MIHPEMLRPLKRMLLQLRRETTAGLLNQITNLWAAYCRILSAQYNNNQVFPVTEMTVNRYLGIDSLILALVGLPVANNADLVRLSFHMADLIILFDHMRWL
jgi:hypothetical protein